MENPVLEPTLTPVQVSEPKTKFPVMYLVLSLLILVFLASTAFLYYQNTQLKNMLASYQTQNTPTPLVSPELSTEAETANWKTYTNTTYKFELKYPSNLPSFKNKIISTSDKPFYVIRELFSSENFGVEYGIEIAIWDNPSKSTLKTWLESMRNAQALSVPAEDFDLTPNYVINGKEALRFWSDSLSRGQQPGTCEQACPMNEVYVVKNDKIFRILFGFSREVNNGDIETLDQILSTFHFLK